MANASDAIYYMDMDMDMDMDMEQVTKTDFHQEMASSPDDFSFDFVEQKATAAKVTSPLSSPTSTRSPIWGGLTS